MLSRKTTLEAKVTTSVPDGNCRATDQEECVHALLCPGDAIPLMKARGSEIFPRDVELVVPAVYLLRAGVVGVYRAWSSGNATLAGLYTPGDVLGIVTFMSGISGMPRILQPNESWQTLSMTTVAACRLSPEHFIEHLVRDPQRLRLALDRIAHQVFLDRRLTALPARQGPEKALAQVLALLAMKAGSSTPSGVLIAYHLTHQDIADIARISRQNATTALGALQDLGLILFRDKEIIVPDVCRLWDLVER